MNIDQKAVDRMHAGNERMQISDDKLTGFGVRVETKAQGGRVTFYWRAKVNGKSAFKSLGEHPAMSVAEAREAAKEWAARASAWKRAGYEGPSPFEKPKRAEVAACPTFDQLCAAYVENHIKPNANPAKPQRTARAIYHVEWFLRTRLAAWKDVPIDRISVEDVLTIKNACGSKRHLANRLVEFVRAIYNWSNDNFWKVGNPAITVKSFPEKRRERFLQPSELLAFNEALKTETHADLKDVLTLAISCGARHSDIFAAKWEDVLWEREVWHIPHPKNGEAYSVQLLPVALQVFERRQREEAVDGAVYVFEGVGRSGHLMDLKKPWIEFRKRAGLKNFRFHDLRHTCASYQAIAGVPLQQIGASLGHKSLQSTMRYAHLIDSAVRDGREAGQAKMVELMEASKKRGKLAAKKTPPIALTA